MTLASFNTTLRFFIVITLLVTVCACGTHKSSAPAAGKASISIPSSDQSQRILLDFEDPTLQVNWKSASQHPNLSLNPPLANAPASTTAPTTENAPPTPTLVRSSLRPNTGLWSLQTDLTLPGSLSHHFPKPADFQNEDTLFASIRHLADPNRSGEWKASLYLVDTSGKKISGDSFPITTQWQQIPFDLATASEEGLDIGHVIEMGIELHNQPIASDTPLIVQTDTWTLQHDFHSYVGTRLGPPKSFYVERRGTRLSVGMVGQYQITFFDHGSPAESDAQRPWFTVSQGPTSNLVLGQPATGLMLLDQNAYDELSPYIQQDKPPSQDSALDSHLPTFTWPMRAGASSRWSWQCEWTSPFAAVVEVLQEVGPFDRLGEPAVTLKWRFMIYQWGQAFVHVEWTKNNSTDTSDPITWALILNRSADVPQQDKIDAPSPSDAERLLSAIYPVSIKQSLKGALPHQLQQNAPIAMIAKTGATANGKNGWWAAEGTERRIFGAAIAQRQGPLDCMLLLNSSSPLMQAASFSTYLIPPKLILRQGELDRTMPGDADNDGLVEPYGFQVIRLAHGRTTFTIYPQERPLFYPAYLFTVPALERDAMDLPHSRMLINIDGKQFTDPPQFPDGSFLLQMPYVIDRPVQVEGILVKK